MTAPQITRLDNGICVASDLMEGIESVSLGCWFNVGTRDEQASENGAAHFLEHMVFKGTKKRTARAIAEEIEAVGGYLNAYTGRERTAYYARILSDNLDLASDILADMSFHATLDEDELSRERGVILQEIGQCEDTPEDVVYDRFQTAAYGRHAMGLPILGSVESVQSLNRATLSDFMTKGYRQDRVVVSAAGGVQHDKLVKLVETYFSADQAPSQDSVLTGQRATPAYQAGEHLDSRQSEQVHLVLGWPSLAQSDPDYYALALFSSLFGGGMASRLFQRIREELGLVYDISTGDMTYEDCGLFTISAGTGADGVAVLFPALMEEIDRLQDGIGEDELSRVRAQFRAGLLMGHESSMRRAERLAHQLHVFGRVVPDSEVLDKLMSVTTEDILRVATRVFSASPTLAAIGPLEKIWSREAIDQHLQRSWGKNGGEIDAGS